MHAIDPGPLSNKLLASLPQSDLQLLLPHFITLPLPQGTVLVEAGDEVDQVYFPLAGMVSVIVVMHNGKAIETATVGPSSRRFSMRRCIRRGPDPVAMKTSIALRNATGR